MRICAKTGLALTEEQVVGHRIVRSGPMDR